MGRASSKDARTQRVATQAGDGDQGARVALALQGGPKAANKRARVKGGEPQSARVPSKSSGKPSDGDPPPTNTPLPISGVPFADSIPTLLPDPLALTAENVGAFAANKSLGKFRRPSMKNVGRDENGKNIKHFYSAEVASMVAMWVAGGADEGFMCAMLNMRPGTLNQLYYDELKHGQTMANMNVASQAYRAALNPEDNPTMTKFWLKARAGWKDGENANQGSTSPLNIHIHI